MYIFIGSELIPMSITINGFRENLTKYYHFQQMDKYLVYATKGCLLITFAKSLDPDQTRENVGPDLDLDPNCLQL